MTTSELPSFFYRIAFLCLPLLETILLFPANLPPKLRAKEMYACHLLSFTVFTSITPHAASSPHTLTAALPSRTVIDLISDGFNF